MMQVRHLVGAQHVWTPDSEIIALIDSRTTHWPAADRQNAREIALEAHHNNQELVRAFAL